MAKTSNCLQLIDRMPQEDQDSLLARLDELQAKGLSPKEAQLQAAIDVLTQLEREGQIRKSSERGAGDAEFKRGSPALPDEWQQRLRDAWMSDASVKIPTSFLSIPKSTLDGVLANFKRGKPSMSEGPIDVWLQSDGRLLVADGNHRYAQAVLSGAPEVEVSLLGEGYSDVYTEVTSANGVYAPGRKGHIRKSADRGYVTEDEISDMYAKAWGDLRLDKKYIELSKAVEDAAKASQERMREVHRRAIEILKSRPGFDKIAANYDDKTIGNLARVFMDQAGTEVPQASPSEQDAIGVQREYADRYFKDVAKIPEPREFANRANQQRDYYDNPSFKRWFKESKVVDAQGNPLVAFHVTSGDFVEFDIAAGANAKKKTHAAYSGQLGSWFTAPSLYDDNYDPGNAEVAVEQFVETDNGQFKDGANTMLVHLSIQNPMEYSDFESMLEDRDSSSSIAAFKQGLVDEGYDGIVIRNSDTDGAVDRDDWVAFQPTQIKSATGNNGEFNPTNPDIRKSVDRDANFKRWTHGLPVIEADFSDTYDGGPAVFQAYHGTTHTDITEFKNIGNKEGALGQGPYFSTSIGDVNENYAGVGPDLTSRIGREIDNVAQGFDDDAWYATDVLQAYFDDNGIDTEITDDNIEDLKDEHRDKAIEHAATKALKGNSEGLVMPVYVRLEKPFNMATNPTYFEMTYPVNEDGEPDYDAEPEGSAIDLINAINEVASGYNADADGLTSWFYENGMDGISAREVWDQAAKGMSELYDDNGELISSGQFMQEVAREMGFDGLIQDADLYFGTQRRGFGGIRAGAMKGVQPDTLHIMPFDGTQVKSLTGNSGEFGENRQILKSVDRPQFYSQLQRAIEGVPDRISNMAAPQWKLWLDSNGPKLGVKKDEIEWSGIKDYLDLQGKKKLSKDDLARYLDDSGVKVSETMLGDIKDFSAMDDDQVRKEYKRIRGYEPESNGEQLNREEMIDELEGMLDEDNVDTKYRQYTLPGGENYREVLITLPEAGTDPADEISQKSKRADAMKELQAEFEADGNTERAASFAAKADALNAEIAKLQKMPKPMLSGNYQSSHWDQKNVLAHIRVNDRTDADGKRVLFVEEVQSDWGQDGKKSGFDNDAKFEALIARRDAAPDDSPQQEELQRQIDELGRGGKGVPSAPFVTKTEGWLNLALKRIAMMAVEGGYDKVAFVNGEQSAERYNLAKQVDAIRVNLNPDGTYQLGVQPIGQRMQRHDTSVPADKLADMIGKDLAQKAIAEVTDTGVDGGKVYSGIDLKVGGEGMIAFYDKIVPQTINKLLPKLGGEKLGMVSVNAPDRRPMGGGAMMMLDEDRRFDQPGFDVTDKMRETVGQGVPMFSRDRLIEDIPNDDWLQGKIDDAKSKGRNQWGVPFMSTVTGYFKGPVDVSLRALSSLKGERNEQSNVREDSLDYIRKNWDEVSKQPPYIEVAYNGEAWVSEGNHRIMVAKEKGIESMPVEIRYFDGGQRRGGPLNPSRIPSLDPAFAEDGLDDGDIRFSVDRSYKPKKTVKAYKLFRADPKQPGKLFPLFVLANQEVTVGQWLKAEIGPMTGDKVKSKIGALAFRPGWHAGDVPVATHIGLKQSAGDSKPSFRNPEHVWAEVEMAADKDWQAEANERGTNRDGKIVPVKAHITDQIPAGGFYRYKTNSNMKGNWLIGGEMKVTRILSDDEVQAINDDAGVADLPRKAPFDAAKYGFDSIRKSPARPYFEDLAKLKVSTNYQLGDLLRSSKKLSWWDRTIGTMYHTAQNHPEFKRVFDAVQHFINDVSAFATRAADMAPNILPKLETLKDIRKSPLSAADVKALRDPIFGGTLKYARNDKGEVYEESDVQKAGVVFTDEELKSKFDLNERQIGLYREFRAAVDQSVTDMALSDMVRYLGKDGNAIREDIISAGDVDFAVAIISRHLTELGDVTPERAAVMASTIEAIEKKAEQATSLKTRGYAPLSRYGEFTVYVPGKGREPEYFGMFESQAEANAMLRKMQDQYPDAKVSAGMMSQESYKLFSGVTPETLALFGETLGLEESGGDAQAEAYQEMLKVAKNNRSAMKRLIERKGIDGYSEDAGRVLAGFIYSNARQISTNLHSGEIGKAAANVKDGDVKDHAIRLMSYIQNPQEEAQAVRGLMFTQFIGGSIASAMVNLTQPFTMTLPYLSQFAGAIGAGKLMADAVKLATRGIRNDEDLKIALKRAEDEGIVSPQEVHQLMAQAQGRGALQSGDGTKAGDALAKANNFKAKVSLGWGKVFSAAEQFNRRVTFIAAYKMAREQGMADPLGFAEKAIAETQGIFNKGNKPVWARGAVGGTLFTFKQFSIGYLEFMSRMWGNGPEGKKAVGLALAVLFLMSGAGGVPGADDLDDLIDGFAQRVLGRSFDSKQAKKEFFASILGQAGAEFVMSGISGLPGMPIDISGRMGLGNLVPGTGIFTKKRDYASDYKEILGPIGTLATNAGLFAANMAAGQPWEATKALAPVAAQNALKAADMASMGFYRDLKGRKVVDTDMWDVIAKGMGFQPRAVAQVQEATGTQANLIAQNKLRETEIADRWAAGRIERNPGKVEEAKQMLADWNASNPGSPIKIDAAQINKRVQEANKTKAQRIAATAPREIRSKVTKELQPAD